MLPSESIPDVFHTTCESTVTSPRLLKEYDCL